MRRARKFPAQKEAVSEARRFAREMLSAHPSDARDQVELMVSELATNCVRHADSDFEIQIEIAKDVLRIEVHDHGPGQPIAQSPAPTDPTGRGLRIVEAMSDSWGVLSGARGKTVWFELQSPALSADQALGSPRATRHGSSRKPSSERSRRRRSTEGSQRSIFEIHLAVDDGGELRALGGSCRSFSSP